MLTKTTKIIILGISIFGIVALGYKFSKREKLSFEWELVKKGNVIQEVSATGQVKRGNEINLSFKTLGRIKEINVQTGDLVEAGDILATLNTTELKIQQKEAKATLSLAKIRLEKLLEGASEQEINVAQTAVANAQNTYDWAVQNLKDVEALSGENTMSIDNSALSILQDSYLKAYNASNTVVSIYRSSYEVGRAIREDKEKIEARVSQMEPLLSNENIDGALSEFNQDLEEINKSLENIRKTIEQPDYFFRVSATDKTLLDTHKSYINTAITNIINSQQTIASTKLTNESNINIAKSQVSSAQGALESAKAQLSLTTAFPRQADIDLYQAQVDQTQAQVTLLENQIEESILKSPIGGQISKIQKRAGETIQAGDKALISLIPIEPFQIEVDIPEVDIGKINLSNSCKITLDAFSEKEFSGKIIEIDPAETIISGVVYYKVKASLETDDTKIKPGMTANVVIVTNSKENVLIIPQKAVLEKDGKKFVRVPSGKTFKEIEIKTGLEDGGGEVEIISGLKEGDKIITFLKSL